MGLFKSMRELNKQSKEISRNWDLGAQLADAQAAMAQAGDMMAQRTTAANLAVTGVDATATVAAVRQGAGMVNYQPVVELDLTVMSPGSPPYPVTVSQVVPQVHLPLVQPGAAVKVKVDPNDRNAVWVNVGM